MIRHLFITFASALVIAVNCHAQESQRNLINDVDQSTVAFHPTTPFIEDSTALLADIDLEKIDVAATIQWVRKLVGGPDDDDGSAIAEVEGLIDSLKSAGTRRLFATASTRSMTDGGPIVIVPCENAAVVNGLATVLLKNAPKNMPQKVHVGNNVVIAGAAGAIDRVVAADTVERPDLILPLKHADRLDHAVVFGLPRESRDALMSLWPDGMPDGAPIQFSPRAMAQDISRIIVSWRLPPDAEVFATVETSDAGAAERVKEVIGKALSIAGKEGELIDMQVEIATVNLRGSPDSFVAVVSSITAPNRQRAQRLTRMNAMRELGMAIHNYYANHAQMPPLYYADEEGTPLLSWRVALLPYLEQLAIQREMELDEPWNSEANMKYSSVGIAGYAEGGVLGAKTAIRAPVYPGSLWHGDGPAKDFRAVTDGTSNTIALIHAPATAAIEWSNPEPWVLSKDDPMSDVFGDRETATVLLLSGSALVLKKSETTNEKLKAMLTIDGREPPSQR